MPAICLVNGLEGGSLDPLDRGLQYGDGVFRTLRVENGKPCWWEEQLEKLAADAARLRIPCPEASLWQADLASLSSRLSGGVLKLLLTRGGGARGYRPPENATATRILIHDPAPPQSDGWPAEGLRVRLCDLRLGAQPHLAGIKHLNRLENVLARAEWNTPEIHEGLLLDAAEHVISGVMSNLFLWRERCLLTPRLDRCGVAGVARDRLLRRARDAGLDVLETEVGLNDLLAAEEVMLSNSLIGLRHVARLSSQSPGRSDVFSEPGAQLIERTWPQPIISPQLRSLLDA